MALGASNLTRGFATIVGSARAAWGPEVEVLAALGHGRSYAVRSRVLVRELPGILECGLWRELESRPPRPTRALVTDVGNDILYGFSPAQILDWVGEAVRRLKRLTSDVVLTGLPPASVRGLSRGKFLFFRSMFVPSCRLPLEVVAERAREVDSALSALAAREAVRLVRLRPEWYGFDPIHVRPSAWRTAWQEILTGGETVPPARGPRGEALRLYAMAPERRWLFGVEQVRPQSGRRLRSGGQVWFY